MFKYFDEWLFYLHAFDIIEMIIGFAMIIMFMFTYCKIDYIIIVHVDQQILGTPPQLDYYWNDHLEYKYYHAMIKGFINRIYTSINWNYIIYSVKKLLLTIVIRFLFSKRDIS